MKAYTTVGTDAIKPNAEMHADAAMKHTTAMDARAAVKATVEMEAAGFPW